MNQTENNRYKNIRAKAIWVVLSLLQWLSNIFEAALKQAAENKKLRRLTKRYGPETAALIAVSTSIAALTPKDNLLFAFVVSLFAICFNYLLAKASQPSMSENLLADATARLGDALVSLNRGSNNVEADNAHDRVNGKQQIQDAEQETLHIIAEVASVVLSGVENPLPIRTNLMRKKKRYSALAIVRRGAANTTLIPDRTEPEIPLSEQKPRRGAPTAISKDEIDVINDIRRLPDFKDWKASTDLRSIVSIPIRSSKENTGLGPIVAVLNIESSQVGVFDGMEDRNHELNIRIRPYISLLNNSVTIYDLLDKQAN